MVVAMVSQVPTPILNQQYVFVEFVNCGRQMPQNGSKNVLISPKTYLGITLEGLCVDQPSEVDRIPTWFFSNSAWKASISRLMARKAD